MSDPAREKQRFGRLIDVGRTPGTPNKSYT
jgi:hypothetical protein